MQPPWKYLEKKSYLRCSVQWKLLMISAYYYATALRVFRKKFLRKIFGPVEVVDDFLILSNSELYELLNDVDFVQSINNIQWMR